jgi:hypothetical protein
MVRSDAREEEGLDLGEFKFLMARATLYPTEIQKISVFLSLSEVQLSRPAHFVEPV